MPTLPRHSGQITDESNESAKTTTRSEKTAPTRLAERLGSTAAANFRRVGRTITE